MRIDSHIHLFKGGFVEGADGADPSVDVDRYEAVRASAGVDAALVVGFTGERRHRGNNDDILSFARRVAWIHPLAYVDETVRAGTIASAIDMGFAGVSAYASDSRVPIEMMLRRSLPTLAERQGLLSLNVTPSCYAQVRRAMTACAPTPVLFSHLGLVGAVGTSLRDLDRAMERLAEFAEVESAYVKISGAYALPPGVQDDVVSSVVETFGWHRVLWGSDFPMAPSLEHALSPPWPTPASSADLRAALGDTLHDLIARVQR